MKVAHEPNRMGSVSQSQTPDGSITLTPYESNRCEGYKSGNACVRTPVVKLWFCGIVAALVHAPMTITEAFADIALTIAEGRAKIRRYWRR